MIFVFRYILAVIKKNKLTDKIDLIIFGGHGINSVKYDGLIYLQNYLLGMNCDYTVMGANAIVAPAEPGHLF